jgi:acetyl esterase/lipase
LRVYRPKNNSQKLPAVFWIHGGGFCFGSVDGDDYLVRSMTREIGCVFVSVDYRLAPEYPYPTPLNDCYAGIEWLFSKADKLSVDSQRIAVGGISAGGGLAAGLALLIRDKGEFNICFQALLCPMIDSRNITDSSYLVTDPRIWNRDSNIIAWQHYMGTTECLTSKAISKYAAPIFANDLHGLPSTYIAVGDVDLFLDEDINYSERLEAAGIGIQLEIFKGGFHAFEFLVPSAKISKLARATHSSAISAALFD